MGLKICKQHVNYTSIKNKDNFKCVYTHIQVHTHIYTNNEYFVQNNEYLVQNNEYLVQKCLVTVYMIINGFATLPK